MSNLSYYEMRKEMCKVSKLMWERRLTNAAGGNFAVRVDDNRVLISPSLMSEEKHCELVPEDFLLIDYDRNILEGTGRLSRESLMHCLILQNFKEIGCTIHAHPFYCMPFVAQAKPIPNVTEATMGRAFEYRKARKFKRWGNMEQPKSSLHTKCRSPPFPASLPAGVVHRQKD